MKILDIRYYCKHLSLQSRGEQEQLRHLLDAFNQNVSVFTGDKEYIYYIFKAACR